MSRLIWGNGSFTHDILNVPDDILCLSLNYLTLENQISIRRVCKRFKIICDILLSRLKIISKSEMQSLSFDGRDRLVKECKLSNLRCLTLVSVELDESLAKHLGRYSPLLKNITVDGACYNRCFEFVQEYLSAFKEEHPTRVPRLQVNNLIEIDDNVKCLLDKFPEWNVSLTLVFSTLIDWLGYFKYISTIIITTINSLSVEESILENSNLKSIFPSLEKIIFSGTSSDDCYYVSNLVKIAKDVVFDNLCIRDWSVILTLDNVKLRRLEVNLNYHISKGLRASCLNALKSYIKSSGQNLKFIKVTTSHVEDSTELIQTLIDENLYNIEFEIGNPSEKFTFLRKSLQMKYWDGSLGPLLRTFNKAQEVSITTIPTFDVFEWIGQIRAFAASRLNNSIHASVMIDGQPLSQHVITINGSNYTLNIPKVVGLNFNLNQNNVVFAYNLSETSQMTDLRNKSLSFMKQFLGDKLTKDCSSAQDVFHLFKSSIKRENGSPL